MISRPQSNPNPFFGSICLPQFFCIFRILSAEYLIGCIWSALRVLCLIEYSPVCSSTILDHNSTKRLSSLRTHLLLESEQSFSYHKEQWSFPSWDLELQNILSPKHKNHPYTVQYLPKPSLTHSCQNCSSWLHAFLSSQSSLSASSWNVYRHCRRYHLHLQVFDTSTIHHLCPFSGRACPTPSGTWYRCLGQPCHPRVLWPFCSLLAQP